MIAEPQVESSLNPRFADKKNGMFGEIWRTASIELQAMVAIQFQSLIDFVARFSVGSKSFYLWLWFLCLAILAANVQAGEYPAFLSAASILSQNSQLALSGRDTGSHLHPNHISQAVFVESSGVTTLSRPLNETQSIAPILKISESGAEELSAMTSTSSGSDEEIDIDSPGPDMGDYPNSAYTLRQGRTQLEFGPASFRTQNANNSSAYATPFLLRYGLTNDVELRLLGTGLTTLISPNETTGFGVLTFDTKIHLWNDDIERFVPAVSFEASIQSQIGSPAFRAGIEPGLFINMDFPFTKKTTFECTFGFTGNQTNISLINFTQGNSNPNGISSQIATPVTLNQNIYAASFQWAVEHELTEKLSLFVHGYYARPVSDLNLNALVTGVGFFRKLSKRVMLFGSANAGLTSVPAPFLTQLGIATQF